MLNLNKEKFFFFYDDCSEMVISPNSLEHGYLAILNNDLEYSKEIFSRLDSPRAKWGVILVSILEGFLDICPTFFQIRNFLEIDLDFLLKNNKINYVEQLLGSLEIMSIVNQEAYKFAARVMYENRLHSAALNYMEKSKQIFYNDPELHFMLSKYYAENYNHGEAYYYICECLKLLPDYYPAILMKQKFEETEI